MMARSKKTQTGPTVISPSKKKLPPPAKTKASNAKASVLTSKTLPTQHYLRCINSLSEEYLLHVRKQISLLFMLTANSQNPAPIETLDAQIHTSQAAAKRSISYEDEKAILEAFTFISSTSIDPSKVSAFCLEECRSKKTTTYVLKAATNHGDMARVKVGLEVVITDLALMSSSNDGTSRTSSSADSLLRSVVNLNLQRLFCRLRSRHAVWTKSNFAKEKRAKPALLPQAMEFFRQCLADNSRLGHLNIQVDNLEAFSKALEALPEHLPGESSEEAVSLLVEIVKICHILWFDSSIQRVVTTRPNDHIIMSLAKIVRYYSASTFLLDKFRTTSSLASMKVEIIKLSPSSLAPWQPTPESLKVFVSGLVSPEESNVLLQQISKIHAPTTTTTTLQPSHDKSFAEIVNAKSPVHAEIQLLFHYELHPDLLKPRLILSTKKPCFLCSLFFQIHGQFHTARSHGRLYEKWALPQVLNESNQGEMSGTKTIVQSFSDALLQLTRDAVSPRKKKPTLMSLESLFPRSAIWAQAKTASPARSIYSIAGKKQPKPLLSTLAVNPVQIVSSQETIKPCRRAPSACNSQETIRASERTPKPHTESDFRIQTPRLEPSHIEPPQDTTITAPHQSTTTEPINILHQPIPRSPSALPTLNSPRSNHHHLHPGSSISLKLRHNSPPTTNTQEPTIKLHTTNLHMHIDLTLAPSRTEPPQPNLTHAFITHLSPRPSLAPEDQPQPHIPKIDISTLPPGVDVHIDLSPSGGGSKGFILSSGKGEEVLLRWGRLSSSVGS